MEKAYTEAQLSRFRRLIRVAARWIFSGDLSERIQEQTVRQAFDQAKRKRKQVSEANLAIILIDALSYHEDWVYEDKFSEKLGLSPKAVRRMLHFLQQQGFVAREHRIERKHGDKVESTAEYDDIVQQARTVSYVAIDYPHFYDMLRLRIHLAKKAAADKVDDGSTVERYACCSRDGIQSVCGRKLDSFDMAMLQPDADGFVACPTCDTGVVAPDDPESQKEPNGLARIRRQRLRREAASAQRTALLAALRPLEAMVVELSGIDPPDFGSLTDWAQRRKEILQSGKGQAAMSARSSGRRGHLDYGIDGPVVHDVHIEVDGALTSGSTALCQVNAEEQSHDARQSLPYFIRQANAAGLAVQPQAEQKDTKVAAVDDAVRASNYEAFKLQYQLQMAELTRQAQQGGAQAALKSEIKEEAPHVTDPHEGVLQGQEGPAGGSAGEEKNAEGGGIGMEWEDV